MLIKVALPTFNALAMKQYLLYTRIVLIFVFLVILAGAVVRTTQSGMGCPDWPTCFGLWVPPTSASQLPPDFVKYLNKQDIDHSFNAFHTWVEYINRLCGALLGLVILVHTVWSFSKFYFRKRIIAWLSFLLLIGVGFEAWLGKTVVDTNLEVFKITAHLLTALLLAIIPVIIHNILTHHTIIHDKMLKRLGTISLVLLLIQIVIGTDVREQVDGVSAALHYQQRETWIQQLNDVLNVHMVFSFVVAVCLLYTIFRSLRFSHLQPIAMIIFILVVLLMSAGFTLVYFNIPAFVQPVHVMLASILFVVLFAFRLRLR